MSPVLIGVIVYVLLQLAVGVLLSRRIRSEDDYLLAGRSLGVGLTTFSAFATWFGAESVVGAAGAVYARGLSGGSADPFGYALCLLVMGLFFAVPLWRRGLTTLADLYRQRFSPAVERVVVLLLVPTSILWAAAQIRAFGQVVAAISGLELELAMAVATAVVIAYTAYGGLLADVTTDFVQGIALIVGLALLFYTLVGAAGGLTAAVASVEPARLQLFGGGRSTLATVETWLVPITGSLLAQELVSRMLAARSPEVARRSAILSAGLYLLVGLIPVSLGLLGAGLLPGLKQPEQLLTLLAAKHLPTVVYVVFAGALISAILSTVDSALLASASLVEHNLIVSLRPSLDDAAKVRIARIAVVVFGVIAHFLALQSASIYQLIEASATLGGAGVFVTGTFGLFTRFGGARAALVSLLGGCAVWLVGSQLARWPHPYLIALAASLLAYILVGAFEARRRAPSPDPAE